MLTFDIIRDLERAERASKKLQRIPESFLTDLGEYIARKERVVEPQEVVELQSVKSIVARLLEMRESKIIDGALITARTGLPPESLLPSESDLFWAVVDRLKRFREDFFGKPVAENSQPAKKQWLVLKDTEFVGPDLKGYKLKQGEKLELPDEIVSLLSKDGVIEETK